jgi:acetyl esterase
MITKQGNRMKEYLAGRLGDESRTLATDPRLDPRIAQALEMAALAPGVEEVASVSSYEDCLAFCTAFEDANAAAHPMLESMMPDFPAVESTTQVIQGIDGNEINLYIHRPKAAAGPLPSVVHIHGGGMVLMTAADPGFIRWRNDLANAGVITVGVEFRNGGGKLGNHPYPAGLNDCVSAVQWTHANRVQLGISTITISGESGGGNLSIATALKANREGWIDQIDGVYAMCPYISGTYVNPPGELVSQVENEGYMLGSNMMGALVKVYDPTDDHANDPLAWPLNATKSDLEGLPPFVVSVNELDPLRDEGLLFYRNLMAAGVSVVARTVHGTPHAGDVSFPDVVPDIYQESLGSVCRFVGR